MKKIIEKENLVANAAELGRYLRDRVFSESQGTFELHSIGLTVDINGQRILLPLTFTRQDVDSLVDILSRYWKKP